MKKSLVYVLGLFIALVMSACAMTNEVHFNKNYSGSYAIKVDFSDMLDMIGSLDPSMAGEVDGNMIDEAMSEVDREEVKSEINQIDGIGNANFEVIDQSRLEFSFDFDDVESLNNAFAEIQSALLAKSEMAANGMNGMEATGFGTPKFSKNGKIITHSGSFPEDQLPEDAREQIDEMGGADGMMDMMMGMMDYTVELSFDRKIKSVEIDGVDLISQDKHMVKARLDLAKMIDGGAYKIDVKTK